MTQMIDILFITYNRPEYTRLSLPRLLETCDGHMRVWLWHNGEHAETLEIVRGFADHPRVHRFHHSPENQRLRVPTNWLWEHADGAYLSKIDDDCLMPDGWGQALRAAHEAEPKFGAIGTWRFMPEDFNESLGGWKIREFGQEGRRARILQNCWVEGSGYLLKRECVDQMGLLAEGVSFPGYCKRLAMRGWIHGWLYPFLVQEHMDDPRSEHCVLKTDDDLRANMPLTAQNFGVTTIEGRIEQIRRHARDVQTASLDPAEFRGWRAQARRAMVRMKSHMGSVVRRGSRR